MNVDLVHGWFIEDEAQVVLNTPLLSSIIEDIPTWWSNSQDNFTVKYAYTLLVNNLIDTFYLHVYDDCVEVGLGSSIDCYFFLCKDYCGIAF